jgi:hypothetical protein
VGAEPTSISLRPGQAYLVTSGMARVTFAGVSDYFEIEIGDAPQEAGSVKDRTMAGEPTMSAFGLNEETAYFRAWSPCASQRYATRRVRGSPPRPRSPSGFTSTLIADERDGDWVDRRLDDVRSKLPIGEKPWTADQARSATPEQAKQAMARSFPASAPARRSSSSSSPSRMGW